MCRRLVYLVCSVFVLGLVMPGAAEAVDPNCLLWWKFDETTGTTATDSSGNNRDGTLSGPPTWVSGQLGGALDFGGGDYVIDADADYLNGLSALSVALWIKSNVVGTNNGFIIFEEPGGTDNRDIRYDQDDSIDDYDGIKYGATVGPGTTDKEEDESSYYVQTTDWQHICVTWHSGDGDFPDFGLKLYINGVLNTPSTDDNAHAGVLTDYDRVMVGKGGKDEGGGESWEGLIDDVQIYSRVVTVEEIEAIMIGLVIGDPNAAYKASNPFPADDAMYDSNEVQLRWDAGEGAVSHDVYFGTSEAAVDGADTGDDEFQDNIPPTSPPPEVYPARGGVIGNLVYGQTYYWRIDEVNEPDPKGPYKGPVWRFTVRPFGTWDPFPSDGATFVTTDVTLTWKAGAAVDGFYDVFFGTNEADVTNATWENQLGVYLGSPAEGSESWPVSGLVNETEYFWRIASLDSGYFVVDTGSVWSLTTVQEFIVTDPNLIGWWTFDEDVGTPIAFDWSGHDNDGTINGDPERVPGGVFDKAMDFNGGDYVNIDGYKGIQGANSLTVTAWIKKTTDEDCSIVSWGTDSGGQRFGFRLNNDILRCEHGNGNVEGATYLPDGEWHHVAVVVIENATISYPDVILYVDGVDDTIATTDPDTFNLGSTMDVSIGRRATDNDRYFNGLMDDVRLYDYALSLDEIIDAATPLTAWDPDPNNGAIVDADVFVECTWRAGKYAAQHKVYFGTASSPPYVSPDLPVGTEVYDPPGDLAYNTTYYWRVDEVNDTNTWTGNEWTFTAAPDIPTPDDPNLIGHWTFDEGSGIYAWDWSDNDNHGILNGDPNWVAGYPGLDTALQFNGSDQYVAITGFTELHKEDQNSLDELSIRMWVKADDIDNEGMMWLTEDLPVSGTHGKIRCRVINGNWQFRCGQGVSGDNVNATSPATEDVGEWTHFTGVRKNNGALFLFINGELVAQTPFLVAGRTTGNSWIGAEEGTSNYFDGIIDDVQVHNVAGLLEAWLPDPANGALVPPEEFVQCSWEAGRYAAMHDVYFGTSLSDVNESASPISPDQPLDANYYVPASIAWETTYYWRIDEVNDSNLWPGSVWSFTTTNYATLDDFEPYLLTETATDPCALRYVWRDGYFFEPSIKSGSNIMLTGIDDYPKPYLHWDDYHDGDQALALYYDNDGNTFRPGYPVVRTDVNYQAPKYSEIEAETTGVNGLGFGDWSGQNIEALELWFKGNPTGRKGSFTFTGADAYIAYGPFDATIIAAGADIDDVGPDPYHDEFHYAYKWLDNSEPTYFGAGTIKARVDDVNDTHAWAKAGVMMRESLHVDANFVMVVVTPGQGVAFQYRDVKRGTVTSVQQTGITAPHWVKLERLSNGIIYGFYTDDVNEEYDYWTAIEPEEGGGIYLDGLEIPAGLCLTSHNENVLCKAEFSDVEFTADEFGGHYFVEEWSDRDIGIISNDPEPLYLALEEGVAPYDVGVVYYEDETYAEPNEALITTWTPWNIDLANPNFADVDLSNVKTVYIGLGERGNTTAGGSGVLYIDDIRLYRTRFVPGMDPPMLGNLNVDDVVDELDLLIMADDWLISDACYPTEAPSPGPVAHWPLDDVDGFDDISGNAIHGDPNGTTIVPDAERDWAATFDGDDNVDCGNPTDPNRLDFGTGNWSVCAWVKTTMSGTGDENKGNIIGKGGDASGGHRYALGVSEAGDAAEGRVSITTDDNSAKRQATSDVFINDGEWHHVVGLRDVNDLHVYVDGILDGTNDNVPVGYDLSGTHQHNAYIGAVIDHREDPNDVLYKFFEGSISDVRIYDYALTAPQVLYLAIEPATYLHVPIDSDADIYTLELPGKQWVNFKDFARLAQDWLKKEPCWPVPCP